MEYLLDTTETIPSGVGFAPFGPCHLAWLAGFILFLVAGSALYRKLAPHGRKRMRLALSAAIVADELLKMVTLFLGGNYSADYLPLHLCSINIFMIAWHAVRPNKTLDNFLYTVCMPAAIFPLLTPAWFSLPPANLMHIHSFTIHILLAGYPILLLIGGDIKPDPKYLPKSLLLLCGLALVALGANLTLGTNFMYLMEGPEGTPLAWFEQACGSHLIGFPVIIVLLLLILYSPALIRMARRRTHAKV